MIVCPIVELLILGDLAQKQPRGIELRYETHIMFTQINT